MWPLCLFAISFSHLSSFYLLTISSPLYSYNLAFSISTYNTIFACNYTQMYALCDVCTWSAATKNSYTLVHHLCFFYCIFGLLTVCSYVCDSICVIVSSIYYIIYIYCAKRYVHTTQWSWMGQQQNHCTHTPHKHIRI